MPEENYISANRLAWNEASPIHERYTFVKIIETLNNKPNGYIDKIALNIFRNLEINNKSVAQLCCNNGRELLSIKKLGAGNCVGFDISDGFIEQAKRLVDYTGIDCKFIRTNIYEITEEYNYNFDIILVTKGSLGWQPDLSMFFSVINRLLKPKGKVFIYEMHPLLDMFWDAENNDIPQIKHSYFKIEPFMDYSGLDFFTKTNILTSAVAYWFHHKMSDIINECIKNGLTIQLFEEYSHDISLLFEKYEKVEQKMPLSYSLIAYK